MKEQHRANASTFRSYLAFWIGQLVSLFGSSVAQFVIVWWIMLETESPLYLGLASLVGFAPMIVVSPFAGVFVDRWNRRVLIGIVDFLQAIATIILILLFSTGLVSVWQVLILLTLRGVFQAFHNPAVSAIVPLMVPKDKLSRMNGLNFLFNGMVTLVGPIIAAVLLESWEIGQILWIDAATFTVALLPLLAIRFPSIRRKPDVDTSKNPFKRELLEGFSFIKNARGLLPFTMLATVLNFLLTPIGTLMPYYVKYEHFGVASDLAFILAFFQGGVLAGGVLMSLIKGFQRKMVAITISVYVIFLGYALLALTPIGFFWFMAISGLVAAACIPIANVSIQTIIQTVVPPEMYGRVNSFIGALASAASPLGMILSGAIVELTGTAILFLGCSISGILVTTLSWFFTDMRYVEETRYLEDTIDTSSGSMNT